MPVYQVTAPDGRKLRITAPEGATQEQALAYAQQHLAEAPQSKADHYAELQQRAAEGPQVSPTDGMNDAQLGMAGIGKSLVDTYRGVKQLFGNGSQQEVDQQRQLDAPLMATTAGRAGRIAGEVGQLMAPVGDIAKGASYLGRATPYVSAAINGGLFNAAQPVGTGESRGLNTAMGAALGAGGQALSSGAGVVAARAKDAMNPVVRESIDLARSAGIPLHLSQVTDSKALKTLSSALNYLPLSGAAKAGGRQQEAFNAAVGRSFGANEKVLSDPVMKAARKRIGDEFNNIYKGTHIAVSDGPIRKMMAIEKQALEDLPDEAAKVVSKQFQKVLNKAEDGSMTGEQYQALRTSLGDAANGTNAGRFIKMLRAELDDVAKIALGPDKAARLAKAHGQWANLRMTEKALKQVSGSAGNVRPASLWALQRNGSTPEMRALAKIGQNVLKDPIPDSGTPARELVYRGLGMGGGAAGAASAFGVLGPAAKLAGAGVTAARVMNSPVAAKYLQQGVPASGLARLMKGAPGALPVLAPAAAAAAERKKKKKKD